MNKISRILALAAIVGAAGLTSSCSDFLDKQPSNELTKEKVLADWNLFEQFHYDTYNFLRHGANRLSGSWLDSSTDLAHTSFASGGTRTSFNIGNYYGGGGWSELYDTWESRYRAIRKCNFVIEYATTVPKNPRNSDEEHAGFVRVLTADTVCSALSSIGKCSSATDPCPSSMRCSTHRKI